MESNDSPEIPDRGETSDIPGLPLGAERREQQQQLILSRDEECTVAADDDKPLRDENNNNNSSFSHGMRNVVWLQMMINNRGLRTTTTTAH